jgi:hypothetical protein
MYDIINITNHQDSRICQILRLKGNFIPQAGCNIVKKRSGAATGPSLDPPNIENTWMCYEKSTL